MINLTLKDIQTQLLSGQLTMVDLVAAYLAEAQKIKSYNAYVELFDKELSQAAEQLDKRLANKEKLGPLFGAVISIKDNMCYAGHLATAGSKILDGFRSPYNATFVQRLLDADALIIGRTNCDEFSMGSTNETSYYGPAKNALDETKVPGGSTGGGAVAVAKHTCLVSFGSDTGGSIRQPAAFNGVIGYKPTYGTISRWGLIAYGSSFDTIGLLGHDISDLQSIMKVVGGPDEYDSTALQETMSFVDLDTKEQKQTIAYSQRMIDHPKVSKDVKESTLAYMADLKAKGYKLIDVDLDFADHLVPCYYILATAEASSNLSRFDGVRYGHRSAIKTDDYKEMMKASRTEGFGQEVKKRIMLGTYVLSEGYYDAYFKKAQQVRRLIKDKVDQILEQYNYLLLPTSTTAAWPLGHEHDDPLQLYLSDMYTVLANLCGIPAISLVIKNINGEMPFGIQIMASKARDTELLDLSKQLTN